MFCSMTGFARCEKANDIGITAWEVRSVNHRYLEIAIRLPEEIRVLDPEIRKRIQHAIKRGKLDCSFRLAQQADTNAQININQSALDELIARTRDLQGRIPGMHAFTALDVLQLPGVVKPAELNTNELQTTCLQLFDQTLHELVTTRNDEGSRIQNFILKRCEEIQRIVTEIRVRQPKIIDAIREKLRQRVAELSADIDHNRLEQELVYLAQKMDIHEELDRIESHLQEVNAMTKRSGQMGRRLEFIMQEFNREANTLSSKSADLQTTQAAVDLRVLIDQMREQVLNLE